jgi:hypothetical protein
MPAGYSMKVVLEGHSEELTPIRDHVDVSCIRRLLDDVCARHADEFLVVFGTKSVQVLLERWESDGIFGSDVAKWVEDLRKAAFQAEDLGEATFEVRNKDDLPDLAPGSVAVFCAVLEYFSAAAGSHGRVKIIPQDASL